MINLPDTPTLLTVFRQAGRYSTVQTDLITFLVIYLILHTLADKEFLSFHDILKLYDFAVIYSFVIKCSR